MDADDSEIIPLVLVLPFLDPRNCSLTVDSTKSPEFEQNDFASLRGERNGGFGIDPHVVGDLGGLPEVGEAVELGRTAGVGRGGGGAGGEEEGENGR